MNDNNLTDGPSPIGLRIRALRKERGLSLAELARRAGTSAPTLHRYESGWDRFELATLKRLAQALGAQLKLSLDPLRRDQPEAVESRQQLVRLVSPLFWDRTLEAEDVDEYPQWVLRRVLMYGNRRQAEASRRFYGDDAVRAAVQHREVDQRTRNYWKLVLESDDPESPEP